MNPILELVLIYSLTILRTNGKECGEETSYPNKYIETAPTEDNGMGETEQVQSEFLAHLDLTLSDCKTNCCDRDDCSVVVYDNRNPDQKESKRCFLYKCVPLNKCGSKLNDTDGLDTYFIPTDSNINNLEKLTSTVTSSISQKTSTSSSNTAQELNKGLELAVETESDLNGNSRDISLSSSTTKITTSIPLTTKSSTTDTSTATTTATMTTATTTTTTKSQQTLTTKYVVGIPKQSNKTFVQTENNEHVSDKANVSSSEKTAMTDTGVKVSKQNTGFVTTVSDKSQPTDKLTTQSPVSKETTKSSHMNQFVSNPSPQGKINQQINVTQSVLSSTTPASHPASQSTQATNNLTKNISIAQSEITTSKDKKASTEKGTSPWLPTTVHYTYHVSSPNTSILMKAIRTSNNPLYSMKQHMSTLSTNKYTKFTQKPLSSFTPENKDNTNQTVQNQTIQSYDTPVLTTETPSNRTLSTSSNQPILHSHSTSRNKQIHDGISTTSNQPILHSQSTSGKKQIHDGISTTSNQSVKDNLLTTTTSSSNQTFNETVLSTLELTSSRNASTNEEITSPDQMSAVHAQSNATVSVNSSSTNVSLSGIKYVLDGYDKQPGHKSHALSAALIAALSFGLLFFVAVLALIGKRCFDSWQRRHYSRIDFLVNGMYN